MYRRGLLAAAAGVFGAGAGCSGGSDSRATLTPAPVRTDGEPRGIRTPRVGGCPALPSNAEVYVCAPTADDGLLLSADRLGDGMRLLELHNGTERPFDTGADWWTLARHRTGTAGRADGTQATTGSPDRWQVVDQGARTDDRRLESGEQFHWLLGEDDPRRWGVRRVHVDVPLPAGRYAFSVVGHAPGGDLTAVVRPLTVGSD